MKNKKIVVAMAILGIGVLSKFTGFSNNLLSAFETMLPHHLYACDDVDPGDEDGYE